VPAWALLTYPGWFELAAGYLPYFNWRAWAAHPHILWRPPYPLAPTPYTLPIQEILTTWGAKMGLSPLAALRFTAIIALLLGTWLAFRALKSWGPWPALAGALLWLYAPTTLYTTYRLGYWDLLWGWILIMGLTTPFLPRVLRGKKSLALLTFLVVWSVRWIALPPEWAVWGLVGLIPLLSMPLWARALEGVRTPALLFLLIAGAAVWTLPWAQPRYVAYRPPDHPLAYYPTQRLVLLEAHVSGTLRPGETVHIRAAWQALRHQDKDWTVFVQVLDEQNHIHGQGDKLLGGLDYPTSRWRVGQVVFDTYTVPVDPNAPRSLRLIMGVYDRATLQRLHMGNGQDHVVLARTAQ